MVFPYKTWENYLIYDPLILLLGIKIKGKTNAKDMSIPMALFVIGTS